jgi:hypothetical protein
MGPAADTRGVCPEVRLMRLRAAVSFILSPKLGVAVTNSRFVTDALRHFSPIRANVTV